MSDGSAQGSKLDIAAAVMASRGLKEQGLAETIDLQRQNLEIVEIQQAMVADKEWVKLATGIVGQLEQQVFNVRVAETIAKMATVYKVGFEAGRTFERESEIAAAKTKLIV